MTRLEAEQASYVESIGDCARSLAQLIDDILDFSKIEAGKLELRAEPFELAPLVESVVELLAPRAQGKALEIASFVAGESPRRMVGDAARLRQVLINLAGNAVNFTEKGGVGVRVGPSGAGVLRFEVEDTGPGVPAAAREAIFEEFEQGDGSATRRHGGTGLGLAIRADSSNKWAENWKSPGLRRGEPLSHSPCHRHLRQRSARAKNRGRWRANWRSSSRERTSRLLSWRLICEKPAPAPKSPKAKRKGSRAYGAVDRRATTP